MITLVLQLAIVACLILAIRQGRIESKRRDALLTEFLTRWEAALQAELDRAQLDLKGSRINGTLTIPDGVRKVRGGHFGQAEGDR